MSSGKSNPSKKNEYDISEAIITYSHIYKKSINNDIYSGNEQIPFRNRHPIFKSLLRIEFEDAIRKYLEIK